MGAIQSAINQGGMAIAGAKYAAQMQQEKLNTAVAAQEAENAAKERTAAINQKVDQTLSGMGKYTRKAVMANPEALKKIERLAGEGYDLPSKGYSPEILSQLQAGNESALASVGKDVMAANRAKKARDMARRSAQNRKDSLMQQKADRDEAIYVNGNKVGSLSDWQPLINKFGGKQ